MDKEKAKRYGKAAAKFIAQVAVATGIVMLIKILWDGMYLLGVPPVESVERVTVAYPSVTDEVKEVTGEKMETAVKLTGFLRYDLFQGAKENDEPLITMTYYTKDGKEVTVAANRKTVWWNGKAHALKTEDMFVNLAEGLYFLDDLVETQSN